MTALPRRLSAPERRQQILDMAASLFVERGFESVTVADLAHELQTSRPTIYTSAACPSPVTRGLSNTICCCTFSDSE